MKMCFVCLEEKPLKEFYTHPNMADGHSGKCKDCTREQARKRRELKINEIREYDRNRSNGLARMAQTRKYHTNNPHVVSRIKQAWISRNPNKRKAQQAVRNAILTNNLTRSEKCSMCGKNGKIEAHHPDYSRLLFVIWVCGNCHKQIHKEEREILRKRKLSVNGLD